MAKQILLIHGGGGGAHESDATLAESLRDNLGPDYQVRYPAMPDEEHLSYAVWKRIIVQQAQDIGEDAILAGHSIGASVLIRMMTERGPKPSIAGLFLVAPPFWHDHKVWRWDEVALSDDAGDNYPRGVPLFLYHGIDDEVVPVAHADMYAEALANAIVRRLPGRNHQINDDMAEVSRDIMSLAS